MLRRIFTFTCCFAFIALAASADEPLPAPYPPGVSAVHRVGETMVNGPNAGQARSMICDLAGRPAVLIYAREFNPAVESLLTKLDAVARKGQERKMRSACILLTEKDDDKKNLQEFDRRAKLEATMLATHPPRDDNFYFGTGGFRHKLQPEAEVTVIVFQKLKVQSSRAFRKGELTERKIGEVVNSLAALLPPMKI